METRTGSSLPANLSQEISLCENKNGELKEQLETSDEEALREKADGLESSLQEAYELQRRTKRDLRREERRLIWMQEELDETLKTIREDRQRIMALHNEQSFTAKQIKDALSIDLKQYEATLRSKQPDLYDYCRQVTNARDCLMIIHSIRQCRRHIQLAEILIANRYASFLSEKPSIAITSPYSTSHSTTAAVTPTAPAKASDGQSPVSSVQSSPLCPALASGGGGGGAQSSSSRQGVKPSQVPVLRYQQQARTKTEKTKPRRLSLVKVDHRTTTPVTTAPATATTTTGPIASSSAAVDRMNAALTTTTSSMSSSMSSSSSASTSHGSLTSSRDVAGASSAAAAAGGGSASTDVVRIEMRECESRPMWVAARDVKPIVLTYVTK